MKRESGKEAADVTILGAGIVGVCCALSALERGLTVTIIDRKDPGEETSYGNAGVISPWSVVPQCTPEVWKSVPRWLLDPKGPVKVRWRDLPSILPWAWSFLCNATPEKVEKISDAMSLLMLENLELYRRYLSGTGHENLLAESMHVSVYRGDTKPALEDLPYRLRSARGAKVEIIGGEELRDLEPDLAPGYHSAALVKDQARARDPGKLCKVLAAQAQTCGAAFRRCEVTALRPREDGTHNLETTEGLIPTRKLVLAVGIWSAELLRPLGIYLPLIAERGYHLEFTEPQVALNNSIQDAGAKIIVSSMNGGVRVAGTAEFASLDAPPNYARAQALEPLAKRLLPRLNTGAKRQWMGIRPSFPDNLPAIGPVPGFHNLIAAFGHSHYGLGMAPGTGRIIADCLEGKAANSDLSMISPARF
ncbi:NAD(P)/FAD-dependent oxidoreductase [Denitrobaculum tricleocarpae]|uniref:FAD-binding oxidoreductase n=1 Tax=Denitrobaculum tricleocarpae TaxID=2591009 RepID=A0A545TER1_9PROT|nr:FAD-dependent oxidoreductase [Denitrobaculum tricleocarpae]TQV75709.1 FAD-binding oxidoreductase [Denitrobaculum tricleocarpae]